MPYANKLKSLNNGRGIGQAWRVSSAELGPISAASVHEWAFKLAKAAELDVPAMWILDFDPLVEAKTGMGANIPESILAWHGDTAALNEKFAEFPLSWEVANGVSPDAHGETPLLWTRGLKPDGTWDKDKGVFGDRGGHIVFADMSVRWFKSLRDDENPGGVLKKYGTREPTCNIYEAVPGGEKSVLKGD